FFCSRVPRHDHMALLLRREDHTDGGNGRADVHLTGAMEKQRRRRLLRDVHHHEFTNQFWRDAHPMPGNRVDNRGITLENRIASTDLYTPSASLIEDNGIACTH